MSCSQQHSCIDIFPNDIVLPIHRNVYTEGYHNLDTFDVPAYGGAIMHTAHSLTHYVRRQLQLHQNFNNVDQDEPLPAPTARKYKATADIV